MEKFDERRSEKIRALKTFPAPLVINNIDIKSLIACNLIELDLHK